MVDPSPQRYVPQKQLAKGAMGEVWLVTDTLLNRPVVFKYLLAGDDPRQRQLFLDEARVLAKLNHPNITAIYDAVLDESAGRFFLVMEYVDGRSLSQLLASGAKLSLETILHITDSILRALAYAHRQGVVHRDLKPGNVMISQQVKLADFGLAGLVSRLSQGGEQLVGSPAYMSPEQIRKEPVSGQADLYALGVMLYQMVTGQRPFTQKQPEALFMAHLQEAPAPVRQLAPKTPAVLEHLIMRLLAKNPADRYPSADALLKVINSIHVRQDAGQSYLAALQSSPKPMVGRAAQLARMVQLWQEQAEAAPRLLLVEGELGIGKSRLVGEFIKTAVQDHGSIGLVGRCYEMATPYAPFAEILTSIVNGGLLDPADSAPHFAHLTAQIPQLGHALAEAGLEPAPAPAAGSPMQEQWQLFESTLSLLARLGPVILFLDDAEYLDEASLALVRFLTRQPRQTLLIIAACRTDLGRVSWAGGYPAAEKETLSLPSFNADETHRTLLQLMNAPVSREVVRTVLKRSGGNPLYMEAITEQLVETGAMFQAKADGGQPGEWQYHGQGLTRPLTQTLAALLEQRLEKLSEGSRKALAVAALLGQEFYFGIWLGLMGGDAQAGSTLDVLDEALSLGFLQDAGQERYRFHPADITAILAAGLSSSRRRFLHGRIAQLSADSGSHPALIAHHFEQAGQVQQAGDYLEAAGRAALGANAVEEAMNYYKRAIRLQITRSRFEALGYLYRLQGKASKSVKALQQALEMAEQARDVSGQAAILNGLSHAYWMVDQYQAAYESATAVLRLPGISLAQRAEAASHLGMAFWLTRRLDDAQTWCLRALKLHEESGDEASLGDILYRLGRVYIHRGRYQAARDACDRSLAIRRRLGDVWGEAFCLYSLSRIAIDSGSYSQASELLAAAETIFAGMESRDGLMQVYTSQGKVMLRQGSNSKALALLQKALRLGQNMETQSAYLCEIYLLLAETYLAQRAYLQAKEAVAKVSALVKRSGIQGYQAVGQALLAQICDIEGDGERADTLYNEALEALVDVGSPADYLQVSLNYARFLTEFGNPDDGQLLERESRDKAAQLGIKL